LSASVTPERENRGVLPPTTATTSLFSRARRALAFCRGFDKTTTQKLNQPTIGRMLVSTIDRWHHAGLPDFNNKEVRMGRPILMGFAALGCVLAIQPQISRADDTSVAMQEVMPDALAALERMGEHLKTLSQFTLSAETTSEDVLDYGEKVMIGGDIIYHVKSPDRLSLGIVTDKRERHYFYNGKTVTVYAPALKFYSSFAAPDTTAKMIKEVEDTYDVEVPLADLFYLGTKGSKADASNIISAFYVSDSTINGTVCAHYAYRTATAHFQVWIHKDGEPLPCKIVRDLVDDPARPQYTAVLTWKTNETFAENVFNFTPPADVKMVKMGKGKLAASK